VECKNKADEQYMPLLLKDIDKIFKINMSRPVKKRKGNTGFFSQMDLLFLLLLNHANTQISK
jgi:hypothetical protein